MRYEFRWNGWNLDHIARHGVTPDEAESVVQNPSPGYPKRGENGKYFVRGQAADGRYLQAVYLFDPVNVIYVIHARDLTEKEKSRLRRRRT